MVLAHCLGLGLQYLALRLQVLTLQLLALVLKAKSCGLSLTEVYFEIMLSDLNCSNCHLL